MTPGGYPGTKFSQQNSIKKRLNFSSVNTVFFDRNRREMYFKLRRKQPNQFLPIDIRRNCKAIIPTDIHIYSSLNMPPVLPRPQSNLLSKPIILYFEEKLYLFPFFVSQHSLAASCIGTRLTTRCQEYWILQQSLLTRLIQSQPHNQCSLYRAAFVNCGN